MLFVLLMSLVALTGCVGSQSTVREAYRGAQPSERFVLQIQNPGQMTGEAWQILEGRLKQQLGTTLTAGADATANRLEVRVDYYRMRHGAVRAMFGIMAGRDHIQSMVTIKSADGRVLGTTVVDSTNPTAMWTSRGLIEGHADEIVGFLKSGGIVVGAPRPAAVPATAQAATPDATTQPTQAQPAPAPESACQACDTIQARAGDAGH